MYYHIFVCKLKTHIHMNQSSNSPGLIQKIAKQTVTHINKIETIVSIVLFALLFTQTILEMQVGVFIILTCLTLVMLYYLAGLYVLEGDTTVVEKFMHKLVYFTLSISLISLFFAFQTYPGSGTFMFVSLLTLGIAIVYLVFQYVKNPKSTIFTVRLRIRVFVIALLLAFASFYSNTSESKMQTQEQNLEQTE